MGDKPPPRIAKAAERRLLGGVPFPFTIYINPAHTDTEIFKALATEIAFARAHDRGYNKGYRREVYRLDSESVGYMVCRLWLMS